MSEQPPTREEVARIELGTTDISPWLARVMVVVFLATAAVPACLQFGMRFAKPQSSSAPAAAANSEERRHAGIDSSPRRLQWSTLGALLDLIPSGRELRDFEDRLNENSLITRTLAPGIGCGIKGVLRGGDEQVYFGHDGWLFYRSSVDSVTGPGFLTSNWQLERLRGGDQSLSPPQPDPIKALSQFHKQLAARGIALVVVPTPGKESLYPEKLAPLWGDCPAVVQNSSFDLFKSELSKAVVGVFDPTSLLLDLKKQSPESVYLKTDTHWSAPAMERVAAQLATWLRERGLVSAPGTVVWEKRQQDAGNTGDIATMLNLPKRQRFFPPETTRITRVVTSDNQPWAPDPNAPVLLMGDSFCNIYSLAEMGWGDSAGFAEHLSAALRQPLDRLVINAGGAHSARQQLVRELASGRDRLAGKRVVIYQFAARELAFGDWKLFDLPQPSGAPREPAERSGELIVQGRVSAIARLPQPGSVPYKDCLLAIHLTQVRCASPGAVKDELLVYAMGMRDNRWLPVASVPAGASVQCRLRDWTQVERRYGSLNRAELDNLELLSLPTFWAEEVVR